MKLNTFAIHTLGCKVNLYESNSIRNQFMMNGLIEKPFNGFADVYIINTCTVTSKADTKSINIIKRAKKHNPNAIVIALGCFTQMNEEFCKTLNIDILLGNKYKNNVYDLLIKYLMKKERIAKIENLLLSNPFEENENINFTTHTRAFIKIQDGCNFMCSYCIIPFSRGRQRSKKLVDVLEEITKLGKSYKEIVITGVNIAGYKDEENDFEKLIIEIAKLPGDFRIRISSLEPFQITNLIIDTITKNQQRFCQQWHICLQSGSNKVLKDMNRKYTMEEFYHLLENIRTKSPMTTFTTDYIVGFPTESEDDHLISMEWLRKIRFLDMHIFPYSKRKNTRAALYPSINSSILKRRVKEITKLNYEIRKSVIKDFINKESYVVFEKSEVEGYQTGFTSEYIKILVKSKEDLTGLMKKVIFKKSSLNGAIGEII
ncbi:MAG: tRNA (N(6)-L-threonylcarbamoyladenosine(37)-C(2))-methylthiotransferase MtaB [Mycoplasmoidaceae bacterium]